MMAHDAPSGGELPRLTEGDVNLSANRRAWIASRTPETQDWLSRDAAVFLHQSLSSPCLDVLAGAGGSEITNLEGSVFLDFHGNSVHQVGQGHPAVMAAIKEQLDTLPFSPRRFTNKPAILLAEKLAALAPAPLSRVLFAPGGTSAVGMALKLARLATGRFKTISMWDAFHGASLDAISVGGEALFRSGIGPLLPGTEHVPPADPRHCPFKPDGNCHECDLRCANYVEYVLEKEGDVAAVIAEPMRCTTVNPPTAGYWPRIRQACDKHGALLIFDETAICLGRTGTMFACEHFGAVPDILILGKGLGGGVMPLAAILTSDAMNVGANVALGHYTHEKSPVACAAGLAAIEVIEQDGLLERARTLGAATLARLHTLCSESPLAGEARGLGLAMGLDISPMDGAKTSAAQLTDHILYSCLERRLSFKISGGTTLTLTPPLTISDQEMDAALARLLDALRHTESLVLQGA